MIPDSEIGGAYVRRKFTGPDGDIKAGTVLSRDDVLTKIKHANRRALIDAAYLEVWPKPPIESVGDKFMVHIGGGRYDVYSNKINNEPLTREEAEDLATNPS